MKNFDIKIKPCPNCTVILNGAFIEYCPACTEKAERLRKKLEKGEALQPVIDGFELFEKNDPDKMSKKEIRDKALEIMKEHPKSRVRFAHKQFYLDGLNCADCGGAIFVDALNIMAFPPEGAFWYCKKCGGVYDKGNLVVGDGNFLLTPIRNRLGNENADKNPTPYDPDEPPF